MRGASTFATAELGANSASWPVEPRWCQVRVLYGLITSTAIYPCALQAKQEEAIEKNLVLLTTTWDAALFVLTPARQPEVNLLSLSEESSELLEEQQMLVQNMMVSKYVGGL